MSQPEAGRDTDAVIAEQMFGWTDCGEKQMWSDDEQDGTDWMGQPPRRSHPELFVHIPHYSTAIAAAWLVVEKLRERGVFLDIEADQHGYEVCGSWKSPRPECGVRWNSTDSYSTPSAALGICLAALEAITDSAPRSP